MEHLIFFSAIIAFGATDISLKNYPSYEHSEYGAPSASASLQVTQENLRFEGQVVEVTTAVAPTNAYLPPYASSAAAYQQFRQQNLVKVHKYL